MSDSGRRRNIAHILAWPNVGGTEIATYRVIRTPPLDAFAHLAFCPQLSSEACQLFSRAGFETHAYTPSELALRRPMPFLMASLALARTFRHASVDLVHCSDLIAAFHAALAAKLARLPTICHVRNPHDAIPRRYRYLLRGVARFVFVSRHAREHFPLALGESRAAIIYDGVESEPFSHPLARVAVLEEFGIPPVRRLVGMAARLAPQKDHSTFVQAAHLVIQKSPDTHFLIVGDHSDTPAAAEIYAELRRQSEQLGVASHLTFTGFRTDIPRLFAAMDVVVLATHFEGFGLVLVEAMAQARPVVATEVGGILEIISDGETGLLHRHRDADHLAAQILLLLQNEALAGRLGQAGFKRVTADFTLERSARSVAELYRTLLR